VIALAREIRPQAAPSAVSGVLTDRMRHNVKMLTEIATISGLAGLIISLSLLAWQTRAVARQTEISNAIARASAISNSSSSFRQVILLFVEYPELRPYFYDSKNLPAHGRKRDRIISAAEILGDILEDGLVVNRLLPNIRFHDSWPAYCSYMLVASPALIEIMHQHPGWWPALRSLQPKGTNQSVNIQPSPD
jgi:hypothetical protein